ncbi:MAG: hypothetical protein HC936_07680 [Leptolyngbyaceae cyanobacterium SU_3_3]|nr:hypothetical protein [Leptolyngbyaceae cyanobacterium SU_3_3]
MAITWDGSKSKVFRLALQSVYREYADLELFLSEELDVDIANISEKTTMDQVVFKLLQKCDKNQVLEAFQRNQPNHPVIAKLQQQPLVNRKPYLLEVDWVSLFTNFRPDDSPYIHIAYRDAFKAVHNRSFEEIRPDHPPLNDPIRVQELLATYNCPILTVRFVESVIAELQRSSEGNDRDLTPLKQWRDRISQQHNVPLKSAELAKPKLCHAYLLVALEAIGSDVNVYPELHITGVEKPIRFGAKPATCPLAQVADLLSQWIGQAEDALDDTCEDGQVTLELFMPYQHLEEDIAIWSIKDKRGDEICLGLYRRFVMRSFDRIRDRQIQRSLRSRWKKLEACVEANNACDQFHQQKDCPSEKGSLRSLLDDQEALGLKFLAQLPVDFSKRTDLFKDIIDAAIPIALWSSETDLDVAALNAEFDTLLRSCCLTNFAELARHWRSHRRDFKHIRLLCDRPTPLPNLPDPNREEDLLVAS